MELHRLELYKSLVTTKQIRGLILGFVWTVCFTGILLFSTLDAGATEPTHIQTIFFLVEFAVMSIVVGIVIAWPGSSIAGVAVGAIAGVVVPELLWLTMEFEWSISNQTSFQVATGIPGPIILISLIVAVICAGAERMLLTFARTAQKLFVAILGSMLFGIDCAVLYVFVANGISD